MSLDIAYSVEADDYIDPYRASDLYWSGVITNPRAFMCPGSGCTAQVTCANLTEEQQNIKMVVHYRTYGKTHSNECEVFNKKPLNLNYESSFSSSDEKPNLDQSVVDSFILNRPDSYYDDNKSSEFGKNTTKKISTAAAKAAARLREIGHINKIYSVRSIVSRFIAYKRDGSLKNRKVNIGGKDISYNGIFKCIWEQDLNELPNYPVIYYGWAYVDRTKGDDGYKIRFKKDLISDGVKANASILVTDRLINSYTMKKLVSTRLKKILENPKHTAYVFVYAKPTVKEVNGRKYANLNISNLDMLDINYDCPLTKEYDK
ncbi:Uncharacterised protein [Yersinia enterocolitica]|uniref:Uncharacterized protein n=1 Tax=Yersinia enterocolitica TaxID=630 RepID=A0A9P1PWG9_YEREN|nr:hypothetical protein [Yersinia enterocolitica]CNF87156.1 Uncharacterised protein [Yersinia enterocolitica]